MTQYYYLVSSLPELTLDSGVSVHPYTVFRDFAAEELSPADYEDLKKCFLLSDLSNLDSLLNSTGSSNTEMTGPSGDDPDEIQNLLEDPDSGLPFIAEHIRRFRSGEQTFRGKTSLDELCYALMDEIHDDGNRQASGFLDEYLSFEMQLKNLSMALVRRSAGLDYSEEVIDFDYFSHMIASSGAADFGLGGDLGVMRELFEGFSSTDPMVNEGLISSVRWAWLDEKVDYHHFSREAVFAFGIKLADIERWIALSPSEGKLRLDQLLSRLHKDIQNKTDEENRSS